MGEVTKGTPDVFISYSTKNKNIADAVVSDLEENGIRCWYAPRDILPGEEWVTAIQNALEASKVLVLIYTSESNQSKQVMNEIALAFNHGLTIVPFRLTEDPMSSELEYYLTRVHWLDAVEKPLKKNITALREYVSLIINTPEGETPDLSKMKQETPGSEGNKNRKTLVITVTVAVLAVLLVLAVILGVMWKKNRPADPVETESTTETMADFDLGNSYYARSEYPQAMACYERAADQGDRNAMKALGDMYYDGVGVEQDEKKGQQYYLDAACIKQEDGTYVLDEEGLMDEQMLNRIGIEYFYRSEFETAAYFFTENAERNGSVKAMGNAALAYQNLMDWENAYIWFKKAIDAGHPDSESFRKQIGYMLNDGLVKEP